MQSTPESSLMSFIPLLLLSVIFGVVGHYLAKDKGRPVARWTILCVIPFVNFYCLMYLIGCTNLRIEAKLDAILSGLGLAERPQMSGSNLEPSWLPRGNDGRGTPT